jgi:hypothetical protein
MAIAQHREPAALEAPPRTAPRRGRRVDLSLLAWLAPAAVALVTWRLSLHGVDVDDLGSYGLGPALPVLWYVSLGIALAGGVFTLTSERAPLAATVVYVAAVAVILYATIPVLSHQPQYTWVYKHIGVVRYLEEHGKADPSIDIYNRWPGFFALGALFSTISGQPNPVTYARWGELFFVVLDLIAVTALLRVLIGDARKALAGAFIFLLANWVGQDYYSPQAFCYVLYLALLVVAVRQLDNRWGGRGSRLSRLIGRLSRREQLAPPERHAPHWSRGVGLAIVLALDAVMIATHQLTPYIALAALAVLMLLGMVRPWWLLGAMALMTIAYFALNYSYLTHNFKLLTSLNPFSNAQVSPYPQTPTPGKVLNTQAEIAAIFISWLAALAGAVALARRGLGVRAAPLAALAVAPIAVVFGQNYGGEASLRIVLFSSPFLAGIAAWGILGVRRVGLRRLLLGGFAAASAALFVIAFFGQAELNVVDRDELAASEWFYEHAEPGSVLMLSAPGFPLKVGASYPGFAGPEGDSFPNLMSSHLFQNQTLGPARVPDLVGQIEQYSPRGYIAFSKDETAFAEVMRITPPGALAELEKAVRESSSFRLAYSNPSVRLFELKAPAERTEGGA